MTLYDSLIHRVPAETAHNLAMAALRFGVPKTPTFPSLQVEALGLKFPSPLGVAAGVDKQLRAFRGLGALGFGFVEVGTITAVPQGGNPKPRVWRFPEQRALINAMGFPNPGATAAAKRLDCRPRTPIVAVNVGKSKRASLEAAAADYGATVRLLAPHADFLVLNVSSPNTPGLRQLQAVEHLEAIVRAVDTELPVLVKVAPDLSDEDLDAVADFATGNLAGIVATNTTLARHGYGTELPGGLSGAPLKERSLEVLQRLYARVGNRLVLVSVGGVDSGQDVYARIRAGATLVQAYTGFVYGGPLWPKRVNAELSALVGNQHIQDLIGIDAQVGSGARVADGAPAPHAPVQ